MELLLQIGIGYDLLGNLTGVEDDLGHTTVITYDSLGRKLSMDDSDMGDWSYTYDELDRLTDVSGTYSATTATTPSAT